MYRPGRPDSSDFKRIPRPSDKLNPKTVDPVGAVFFFYLNWMFLFSSLLTRPDLLTTVCSLCYYSIVWPCF